MLSGHVESLLRPPCDGSHETITRHKERTLKSQVFLPSRDTQERSYVGENMSLMRSSG